MGKQTFMASAGEVSGNGKGCSVIATVAIAVLVGSLVALTVGLAVGLGKKSGDSGANSVTPSSTMSSVQTTSPGGSTTLPPPTGNEVFLPKALRALHYDLRLRPQFTDSQDMTGFRFTGDVMIQLDVINSTDKIVLHAKLLTIPKETIVVTASGQNVPVVELTEDKRLEFLTIKLERALDVGSPVWGMIKFSGPLSGDLAGLYMSRFNDSGVMRNILTSQMEPTDARKAFPCMDEPALKATFNISIERRPEMMTLSNTVIYKNETIENGQWVVDYYSPTPKMATYLLAIIVANFVRLENSTNDGKKVYTYVRPNAIDQARYASGIAARIQDHYAQFYNIDYPLQQQAHVAVPDFAAGAMENWGCIIYRETALLYDPTMSTAVNKQRVAIVVAHELAHMWFGDLVTPAWWDDIWLNEGFASFMEYIGVDSVEPTWNMLEQFIPEELHLVMRTDALMTSHPIYQSAYNPDEIMALFDSISYSKGASVIRMMYSFLGPDIFKAGITRYLNENKYGSITYKDLFRSLSLTSAEYNNTVDVTSVMSTWLLQMGYPVVHLSYNNVTGVVALSQNRFLLMAQDGAANQTSPYNFIWSVPVNIATNLVGFDNLITEFLYEKQGTMQIAPGAQWIIGNAYESYYYRVNYDESMWTAITNQLMTNHTAIASANRAQLIDDVFSLARPGVVSQVVALNVSQYLSEEVEYVPWTAASSNFGYIRRMLAETPGIDLLQRYMQKQIRKAYNNVTWNETRDDPHLTQRLRILSIDLACTYKDPSCLSEASEQFKNLASSNSVSVGVNVRGAAYCYGIKKGGTVEWNQAFEKYTTSNLATEQVMILQALACTDQAFILAEYLRMTNNESLIRRQDMTTVFVYVARNTNGQQLAWDFIRVNWNTIYSRFAVFSLSNILSAVTESFSTQARLDELQAFIQENANKLGSAQRTAQQAVESTKANIAWRQANEQRVYQWLQEHV